MMEKFIRIDRKGEWRGTEHCSSMNGLAGEYDGASWESGISCYSLKDKPYALNSLVEYWVKIASMDEASDYEEFQVTVFEGEKLDGMGADWEDMAECTRTVLEIDAKPFMKKLLKLYDDYVCGEIDDDEYDELLEKVEV